MPGSHAGKAQVLGLTMSQLPQGHKLITGDIRLPQIEGYIINAEQVLQCLRVCFLDRGKYNGVILTAAQDFPIPENKDCVVLSGGMRCVFVVVDVLVRVQVI